MIEALKELKAIVIAQWAGFRELPVDLQEKLVESGIFTLQERHIEALSDAIALQEQLNPQEANAWMHIANDEIGVKEIPGAGFHPRIVEYFRATTYHATSDEVPWCSAFANWVLMKAGYTYTKSAAACSWLFTGETLETPRYGCGVVTRRAGRPPEDYADLKPDQGSYPPGHVCFYTGRMNDKAILCLGGNQKDSVCTQPFPDEMVLRYFWPEKA